MGGNSGFPNKGLDKCKKFRVSFYILSFIPFIQSFWNLLYSESLSLLYIQCFILYIYSHHILRVCVYIQMLSVLSNLVLRDKIKSLLCLCELSERGKGLCDCFTASCW